MKILVAEDSESLTAFYTSAFASMNLEAEYCSNGQECLDRLRSQPYDVLLLDLIMPVMDGFAVLRIVSKEFPDLKVVITSVQDDRHAVVELLKQGATAYLSKPFTARHLREVMDRLDKDRDIT